MCGKYEEFFQYSQPYTVGGPTGQYILQSPAPNAELVEWAVIAVANGPAVGSVVVSSAMETAPIPQPGTGAGGIAFDGTISYQSDVRGGGPIPGVVYHLVASDTKTPPVQFFHLLGQNISVAVGATGTSSSILVTIQFRWLSIPLSVLNAISADPISLDGEHENQINKAREQRVNATISRVESMTHAAKRR